MHAPVAPVSFRSREYTFILRYRVFKSRFRNWVLTFGKYKNIGHPILQGILQLQIKGGYQE